MEYAKTILAMIGLVLIGFFAGYFTHQQMMMNRIKEFARSGMKDGFQQHFFMAIDASEEQRKTLKPIVDECAEKMSSIYKKGRQDRKVVIEQLHKDVKPHLTQTQLGRLKRFSKRFRGRPGGHPRHLRKE